MLDFLAKAPAAREAHPRTEHWAPLYVALGAASASGGVDAASVIDGFWYGLSKRVLAVRLSPRSFPTFPAGSRATRRLPATKRGAGRKSQESR